MISQFNSTLRRKYRRIAEADTDGRTELVRHALVQYAVLAVVALPWLLIFGLLWVIRPVLKVRIGLIIHGRIGHLAGGAEIFLRRRSKDRDTGRRLDIMLTSTPASHQVLRMGVPKARLPQASASWSMGPPTVHTCLKLPTSLQLPANGKR